MDALTIFGAVAVTAMLVFYSLESRSASFVLAFAAACLASSAYGFLQGAWPFGVVELIWSGVALRRWWLRRTSTRRSKQELDDDHAGPQMGHQGPQGDLP